jgi:hypothetical protein
VNLTLDPQEVDDFLQHFGVKGMHWGVRRESAPPTNAQQRASLEKKISRINGQTAVSGYELRGSVLAKQYKRNIKKDPNWSYGKLSPEKRAEYTRKADAKVTRKVIALGVLETSAILGGGALAYTHIKGSDASRQGAAIGAILLAGKVGQMRISQVHQIYVAGKLDELQAERAKLRKAAGLPT